MARARPDQLAYSSAGNGTPPHLSAELLSGMTGIKLIHVPYKGGGPSIIALLSGEAQLSIASLPSAIGHMRSGKLRALGVTTPQRTPSVPDLPTIAEAGVPGYSAPTWTGLVAPPGTPRAIVDKLNATANKLFQSKDFEEKFARVGDELAGGTPEDFAKTIKTDLAKWKDVVERSGAKLE